MATGLTRKQIMYADLAFRLFFKPELVEKMKAEPHPHKTLAGRGKTRYDWATFLMERGATEGRSDVGRYLERVAKKLGVPTE